MDFITNEKLTIVGAAGMIGSNMAQTAIMMRLTNNICLYDVFSPEGVAEEMRQCGFDHVNITATTDPEVAFKDAKYVISSGGAPRKEGMTREDLLAGNAAVAKELGENIKKYCPDVKHVVIIFNPADITGLVTLLYSGLKPNQLSTLAALDSTRLQSALAKHFGIEQYKVRNCCTFGGHGEQMAVFASPVTIDGTPLLDIIGTGKTVNGIALSCEEWDAMKKAVTQGGAAIIKLRGRSSFQSPSYLSVEMIGAAMGGEEFKWPVGCYVASEKYHHIMMAMPSRLTNDGVYTKIVTGTDQEMADLDKSYGHLCALRDQVIAMGVLPAIDQWKSINPNL
ncbi:MAG: malate dehydrogenase [Bacteroidales bacterium]|nr:malate dehydrogenase [Bacteroidales bacterium]MCD8388286.1 malate dehydrogenase [Bacteroidales bacterium]